MCCGCFLTRRQEPNRAKITDAHRNLEKIKLCMKENIKKTCANDVELHQLRHEYDSLRFETLHNGVYSDRKIRRSFDSLDKSFQKLFALHTDIKAFDFT